MKIIKQILAICLALTSFNSFASEAASGEANKKNHNFYIKAVGGGTYTNGFDTRIRYTDEKFNTDTSWDSKSSGFAQIGVGVWSDTLRGSFELNYIKPFGNTFNIKDKDKHVKDLMRQWTKTVMSDTQEIAKAMNLLEVKKSEIKMELDDYHIFIARISADIVKQQDYSCYLSFGMGASYFGGDLKEDMDYKLSHEGQNMKGVINVESKLKKEFHPTALFGLGADYKINESISLVAQYDLMITSVEMQIEKTTTKNKITVDGQFIQNPISGKFLDGNPVENDQIIKIDIFEMYNHNFGIGLKINF
jgi:hypothetical protein